MTTRKITFTALLCALICICAPLSVTLGFNPIPISLATFAIYIAASTIDTACGVTATVLYIVLGAVGLPVFSNFGAGLAKLVGPTGGYIIGYIPCALIIGLMLAKHDDKKYMYFLSMALGTLACYALGTAWFMIVMKEGLLYALSVCVVPFLIGDAIKIIIASLVAMRLRKVLKWVYFKK